jgi:hypothetical protein
MPENQYFLIVNQSKALLQRVGNKKKIIHNLGPLENQIKRCYDLRGWENILTFLAFMSVKTLEIKFLSTSLKRCNLTLHGIVLIRKVLTTIHHVQEDIKENEHSLRHFILDADNNDHKAGRKIFQQISIQSEKLFSFPFGIPIPYGDVLNPEFLEFLIFDIPEQINMEGFINELDVYLESVMELMELVQVTQLNNFDALRRDIDMLSAT